MRALIIINLSDIIIKKGAYKRVSISIDKACRIKVSAPISYGKKQIEDVILSKKEWIEKTLAKIRERNAKRISVPKGEILYEGSLFSFSLKPYMNKYYRIDEANKIIYSGKNLTDKGLLRKFYKERACMVLKERVKKLAAQSDISITGITIRLMKSRWGSCSSKGAITLNERLITTPLYVMDSVIYHELAHRKVMNHSHKFYDTLKEIYPEYVQGDIWLSEKIPMEYP